MKIFDFHHYWGPSLFGRTRREEDLHQLKEAFPQLKCQLIPNKPLNYCYPAANEATWKMAEKLGWPWALRIDPWRVEEASEEIKNTPAKALFLHPFEEQFYPTQPEVKDLLHLWSEKENGKIVILAAGYEPFSHPSEIPPLISAFPHLKFVITHGGQINIAGLHLQKAFEIFQNHSNTYFETSGIYRGDYIEEAIEELGPQRVVFGTATPLYDFEYEMERIEHLHCPPPVKSQILAENGLHLLGLEKS